ncbi:AMP binding protein [Dendrothele bispora CBS 962.96]|uniref:AMP binding protein n=1 Tax=Dendrothele bispora (strain CBS 962.96) TaxID=1314807 RepID=A0A4S8L8K2_DENBC|nr:AMP binding protein [Dendrothele bispora CBS 962.96]
MAPRIYTSPVPSIPVHEQSIFTRLLSQDSPTSIAGQPATNVAFVDAATGTQITRGQLRSLALTVGYSLRNHPKISAKRGDTILLYSPNSLAWPVVVFGAIAAGLKCTFANSAYTATELAHQYDDSRAKMVMTSSEGLPVVRDMFKGKGLSKAEADARIIVIRNGLSWAGGPDASAKPEEAGLLTLDELLKSKGSLKEEEKFEGKLAKETAFLCYSSGTTGKPKGVETTHQNVTSVIDSVKLTFPPISYDTDRVLAILPMYHIYGAVKLIFFPLLCGTPCIIMPRFDPEQFCANIQRYKVSTALIVPPVLVVMARHPVVDKYDLSSLKVMFSGAAPLGADLVKQVTSRFLTKRKKESNPSNELAIVQGYGLTETSPTTHLLPVEDAIRKIGSIGILLANLEARLVVDDEGGPGKEIDAPEGERGELWIRGPTVMKGYLNNPSATANSITPDGWFKTGDIAIRDKDGYYFIVDRRKELIKYKGFQVPPAELEGILLTHPDIADAAVIGVESVKEATELPRAYVVHAKPSTLKSEADKEAFGKSVAKWMETKVARHKFLRGGVVIIDIVPKSAAGKILRRELRDRAKQELVQVKAKL